MDVTGWVAFGTGIWGALLSTLLGILKLLEYLRTRVRLETSTVFRGDFQEGHDIVLTNLSSTPVVITAYDLILATRRNDPKSIVRTLFALEDQVCAIEIAPMSAHKFHFANADYFPWPDEFREDGSRAYMRLWVAGRKGPLWRQLSTG